jgi:SAM-dependent methyltransferase
MLTHGGSAPATEPPFVSMRVDARTPTSDESSAIIDIMFPIRLGSEAQFKALRESLQSRNFTEPAICKAFNITRTSELRTAADFDPADDPTDVLRILVRLFIGGCSINPKAAANLPMRELASLGLISTDDDEVQSNVMLYPTHGLYIVSDRNLKTPEQDVVYPAIVPNTDLFLNHIPRANCDAFLDLCAGTGVAALIAAQTGARHAWAFDITARSTHFAEFNRRLNSIPNVTAAEGDLYDPAGGQTFDRIVAHPPYLPVYRQHVVYDSGGQDGEQIVCRIVEGLPRYLRPGGRFYALTLGSDREKPFENRMREWLGDSAHEFDVAFVVRRTLSPRDYAADAVIEHKGSLEDITRWRELFTEWGVRSLVYGLVVIQRRDSDRPIFTIRRDAGPNTGPAECAWLIDWATAACDANVILHAKPRAGKNATLRVDHRLASGKWQPQSYRLESSYPFSVTMRVEPWAADLLTIADGSRTTSELLPENVEPLEFARIIATMIFAGLLEIDEYKLTAPGAV